MSDTATASASGGGVSALTLLGVAFVILKLTHVISWSWWYVTMPFWGGIALVCAVGALFFIAWGIAVLVAMLFGKWK